MVNPLAEPGVHKSWGVPLVVQDLGAGPPIQTPAQQMQVMFLNHEARARAERQA